MRDNMRITKQILKTNAQRLLETLDEGGISSYDLAEKVVGGRMSWREASPDYIGFNVRPSNFRTKALHVSYICPSFEGVPLALVINPTLKYRQILIKCIDPIHRFKVFGLDNYGVNLQQFRVTMGGEAWTGALQDVRDLVDLL